MTDDNIGSHLTRADEVHRDAVQGIQVHILGPLNIAYRDGETATVYVKFPTEEDSKLWHTVTIGSDY
jgi:hypothetical protein